MHLDHDDLVKNLRDLSQAVIAAASTNGGGMQSRRWWVFQPDSNGTATSYETAEPRIDWPRLNIEEWISTFPTFDKVTSLLGSSPHIQTWITTRVNGPDPIAVRNIGLRLFIKEFVTDVADERAWKISDEKWKIAIANLLSLVGQGKINHRTIVFLHGVAISERLDLGDLILRPPTRSELLTAFNPASGEGPDYAAISCAAVIEATESVTLKSLPVIGQRTHALVTALRIWTGNPITPFVTYQTQGRAIFTGETRPLTNFFPLVTPPELPSTADFQGFWLRSRDVLLRPPSALGVALRRLNLMIDVERGTDRVLDLCIVLEALFQLGDEKAELAYRLSMRTAHFVGSDYQSRQKALKTVKAGYNLRSRIAHGSAASSSDRATQDELEKVVFAALRLYCEQAAGFSNDDAHKGIIDKIDGYLLERRGDPV